jgi:hypothetical protein
MAMPDEYYPWRDDEMTPAEEALRREADAEKQLEVRLAVLEKMIQNADAKDLPYLNATYQKLLDRLVALDLSKHDPK